MVVFQEMWIFDLKFVKLKCVWEGGRFFFSFSKICPTLLRPVLLGTPKSTNLKIALWCERVRCMKIPKHRSFFTWGKKLSQCHDIENVLSSPIDLREFAKSFCLDEKKINKDIIVEFTLYQYELGTLFHHKGLWKLK